MTAPVVPLHMLELLEALRRSAARVGTAKLTPTQVQYLEAKGRMDRNPRDAE